MSNQRVLADGDEVEHDRENGRGLGTKTVDLVEYRKAKSQRTFHKEGAESVCSGLKSFGAPRDGLGMLQM